MSKDLMLIRQYLREICDADVHEIFQGTVTTVNSNGTIDVLVDDEVVMPGIRLRVVTGTTTGIVATPATGANVVYASIERGQDYQLISASEISRLYIRAGNTILDVTGDSVVINEGKLGGLAVIAELKAQMTLLETNNTLLRTACSVLANALNALAPGVGPAFDAAVANTQPLDLTKLENKKVKQ